MIDDIHTEVASAPVAPDAAALGARTMDAVELAGLTDPRVFNLFSVPDRMGDGDPWSSIDDVAHSIEPLIKLYEDSGEGEANYPPDYPKMPGEPPRVQPSKKVASHWNEKGERIED